MSNAKDDDENGEVGFDQDEDLKPYLTRFASSLPSTARLEFIAWKHCQDILSSDSSNPGDRLTAEQIELNLRALRDSKARGDIEKVQWHMWAVTMLVPYSQTLAESRRFGEKNKGRQGHFKQLAARLGSASWEELRPKLLSTNDVTFHDMFQDCGFVPLKEGSESQLYFRRSMNEKGKEQVEFRQAADSSSNFILVESLKKGLRRI